MQQQKLITKIKSKNMTSLIAFGFGTVVFLACLFTTREKKKYNWELSAFFGVIAAAAVYVIGVLTA